ncbi:MAG TPA: DsbA family protein [Roseiflexaceae bacterium]|nr:DsbA family protein [Roseiflexaceae bacterium]
MSYRDEELLFGTDPLCGWCFAFRPAMRALTEANPDLPIRVIYGGLVIGERVQPVAAMRSYLTAGLEEVRRRAGVVSGEGFQALLADGRYISNSEPPCRAIWTIQQIAPAHAYPFADALSEAFYIHGQALDEPQVLADLAARQGVDPAAFLRLWDTPEAHEGTRRAFAQARADGISVYPTLIYRRGESTEVVTSGWLSPEELLARVAALREGQPIGGAQTIALI